MNVGLLKAAKDDLPDVVRMAERIWRHHFPGIISEEQIDYMLQKFYSLEVMTEEIERGRVKYCFILHDGDRVGFCAFGPAERPEEMRIHKLYVLPQFQRHGFGSMNEYFFWLRSDYFCKHLIGDYSQSVDIKELNNEIEKKR